MRTTNPFGSDPFAVPPPPTRRTSSGTPPGAADFLSILSSQYGADTPSTRNTQSLPWSENPYATNFDPQAVRFGEGTPDLFNKRNSPGKKDNWSMGDAANSQGDIARWLFGLGGDLTGGTYDMFSQLLGGQFPDALEGHYPNRLAGELQTGSDALADAWGQRAGAIRKDFVDSSLGSAWDTQQRIREDNPLSAAMAQAQSVLDPALAQGQRMIHDQGAANQAQIGRQIREEMGGGMAAKMIAESADKRVASDAQAIEKLTSELTQATMLPALQNWQQISQQGMQQGMQSALSQALQAGMGMEATGQLNIANMTPNVLTQLMSSVYPQFQMNAMNAAMNVPSQMSQWLTSLANIRGMQKQTSGGSGGFMSGLMGMLPKFSMST